MQLNRLCIILPADLKEIKPFEDPKIPPPVQDGGEKDRHRGCGGQILHFLGGSLRRLHDSKWIGCFQHDKPGKHGLFYDLEGVQLPEKVGGANPRIFSYAELYIGSKGFCEDEVLGSGGFGKVYRAVLPSDGTVVAVKCLAERGEQFEKTFEAELVAVAHLRHRNLVRLRGWCVHEDQLLLVYDYMPNRSLDRVLFRRPENLKAAPLSWERRRNIVGGLAAALHYLHEQLETQIIHRDVKTSNVMLDSSYNARLGDFGLARWLEHELGYQIRTPSMKNHQFHLTESTKIGGTIGYLPPESFQKRSVATAKSDVFSFGVVVLEVVSGRRAVDLTCPDDQIVLLDWIRGLSGDDRLRDGSFMLSDMERLIHLGLLCTLHNPQLRPNMKWVVEALSGNILGRLPPLPSFQSHPRYIAISSASNTSTSRTITTTTTTVPSSDMTVSFASSAYVTAMEETIYETAEFENINKLSSSKSNNRSHRKNALFMVETPREISYKEIIYATNNFSDSQRVAEVDFGTAYYGILEDGHQVLVKRLGMTQCPAIRVRFSTELLNLGRLRHRNLIQLRGWCTELGEMLVVYDYSASRHLSHLLFHHDNRIGHSILLWRHRYNIIKSLASAVLYLHEEWDEQVIHRNITNSSIILDTDMNPRLGNFALAEFLARNDQAHKAAAKENNSVRGIFGYMSPEYLEHGEATPMADVYSYGVVVLEVVSGQMAVDFRRPEVLLARRVHEFEAQKRPLEDLADIRLNGAYDHEELIRVVKLGIACTRSDPGLRPTMRQIVRILDGNDQWLMKRGRSTESREDWRQKNASSLSMIRSVQALGIQ
uniref:Protein kinase domain-containing protein n=1 Tax=Salix viminalis TaxID=40686 RepID=A0A6N2MD83_SALVM